MYHQLLFFPAQIELEACYHEVVIFKFSPKQARDNFHKELEYKMRQLSHSDCIQHTSLMRTLPLFLNCLSLLHLTPSFANSKFNYMYVHSYTASEQASIKSESITGLTTNFFFLI